MTFQDLDEFFSSDLRLPIGGKEYVIPSADAATGLQCQRLFQILAKAQDRGTEVDDDDLAKLDLDDEEERSLYERLLGTAMDDMVADGVAWEKVKHCGITALIWTAGNTDAAEKYWASGGIPEAQAPNRAARRAGKGSGRSTTKASPGGTTRPKVIQGRAEPQSAGTKS
jgi:hypothetical protein